MLYNEKIFKRFFNWPMRRWYKNVVEIPRYFKAMHYLVKHGYDEYATWETYDWFIDTMQDILKKYKAQHRGVPIVIDNFPFTSQPTEEEKEIMQENEDKWNDIVDRMIELLDLMDECSSKYKEYEFDFERITKEKCEAKEEFFELFAEYFYNLWD